ncbi:putative BOI-related E3 ubiquitin-protein ligase 3 [Iris pallida]|uniref:BOI-related E3 ubiquitin-protein ligase 3 n=1 Tax=Iris pallida TaxID=29817 RepID=A0AAX6HMI6_IRIPA|nr:putative BOI-related E3 ubiquitin-protein ligase 3 [Iris pallida]
MQQQHLVGAFFSGPPIDMTCCDASGMRKRARDRQELPSVLVDMNSNVDSLPSHFRHDEQPAARLVGSTGASTSGRPAAISPPLAVDLYSHLYQHNIEIDAIIRLQTERLRLVVEESRKRQWRAVVENSKVAHEEAEREGDGAGGCQAEERGAGREDGTAELREPRLVQRRQEQRGHRLHPQVQSRAAPPPPC